MQEVPNQQIISVGRFSVVLDESANKWIFCFKLPMHCIPKESVQFLNKQRKLVNSKCSLGAQHAVPAVLWGPQRPQQHEEDFDLTRQSTFALVWSLNTILRF